MKRWTNEEMATKMNMIHNMDCLEFMKKVPDDYFDLVFTDPPYNVGIDYGIYKDNLSDESYLSFVSYFISEIKRISKHQIIYPPKKYFLDYWKILGKSFQQVIFTTSTAGSIRYKHKNQFTSVLVDVEPNGLHSNHYHNIPMPHDGFMFKEDKYGHKGYTSNQLISLLLDNYTEKNYSVFDPFMGTGSVAVVSKSKNLDYCGCDIEPKYCDISNKRLEKVQTSMFAFMGD